MTEPSLIPVMQAQELAQEVERQLASETAAVLAVAERDAGGIVGAAHAAARRRVQEAIEELRREGARRLASAKVELDTERRVRAQHEAARAVNDTWPLLERDLDECWRDRQSRLLWTDTVARLCRSRLRPCAWLVEHPPDWSAPEQSAFSAAVGTMDGVALSFAADGNLRSGLRIKADQAVLDATPSGLLADRRTVAALILDKIESDE